MAHAVPQPQPQPATPPTHTHTTLIPYSASSAACCRQRCQEGQKYAFMKKREREIMKIPLRKSREREGESRIINL